MPTLPDLSLAEPDPSLADWAAVDSGFLEWVFGRLVSVRAPLRLSTTNGEAWPFHRPTLDDRARGCWLSMLLILVGPMKEF